MTFPSVRVPYEIAAKLARRYERLKYLREIGAPDVIVEKEKELVEKALADHLAFMIEQGHIEPRKEGW